MGSQQLRERHVRSRPVHPTLEIPILAVAIDSDGLYPPAEQVEIAERADGPIVVDGHLLSVSVLNAELLVATGRLS